MPKRQFSSPSIAPVRHRMTWGQRFIDNYQRVHRFVKGERGQHAPERSQVGLHTGVAVLGTVTALALGVPSMEGQPEVNTAPGTLSEDQQRALTTERYDKCAVTTIKTWGLANDRYRIGVQWLLAPNVDVNTTIQQYEEAPNVNIGPTRPVIRPYGIASDGTIVTGRPVTEHAVDYHDTSSFSALLPKPQGNTHFALFVRNEVTITDIDGSRTEVSGEQPCVQLVLRPNPDTGNLRWESRPLDPALLEVNNYAVKISPAEDQ